MLSASYYDRAFFLAFGTGVKEALPFGYYFKDNTSDFTMYKK